ncbi:ABC transporter ATP-binding protein [Vallitalea longa]|nr:ABC transporter ATP-binding protein [Vallitalea longa]
MKVIEVNNLVKKYGDLTAVDNISFAVDKGDICAILGPNGSGKTTTIKSICNLIIPDSGDIRLYGKRNVKSIDKVAALFEGTRNLYWRLTPRENLRYFAGIRGLGGKKVEDKIDSLLDDFDLSDKKDTVVNNLSRGMKQKVAIAMALICDTEIVILDEPTLGLDVKSFMEIKNILKYIANNMKKTVLLCTHDMNLVEEVCNDVVILNNGKIVVHDTMSNLLDMFKSMTYEINLQHTINEQEKICLSKLDYELYLVNEGNSLEIDILDIRDIYDIIDSLKQNKILIKEFKQKNVNFERVYLNLTSEVND